MNEDDQPRNAQTGDERFEPGLAKGRSLSDRQPDRDQPEEDHEDHFVREVRRQIERHRRARPRGVWENLALIGGLGWMIMLPALAGLLVGRWLDSLIGTGILWTLVLLLLGIATGGVVVWRQMQREL